MTDVLHPCCELCHEWSLHLERRALGSRQIAICTDCCGRLARARSGERRPLFELRRAALELQEPAHGVVVAIDKVLRYLAGA